MYNFNDTLGNEYNKTITLIRATNTIKVTIKIKMVRVKIGSFRSMTLLILLSIFSTHTIIKHEGKLLPAVLFARCRGVARSVEPPVQDKQMRPQGHDKVPPFSPKNEMY